MPGRAQIFCVLGPSCPPELATWLGTTTAGQPVQYPSAETFLAALAAPSSGCVVASVNLPGMSGWALLEKLADWRDILPVILIDDEGSSPLPLAVQAARNGVGDLLRAPVSEDQLVKRVALALQRASAGQEQRATATALLTRAGLNMLEVIRLAREQSPAAAADAIVVNLCLSADLREAQIPASRRDWLRNVVLQPPIEELTRIPAHTTAPAPWLLEAAHYIRKCAQDVALSNAMEKLLKVIGVAREGLTRREMTLVENVAMLALREQSMAPSNAIMPPHS